MAKARSRKRKPKMGKAASPRAPVTLHCPHCKQERIFGYDPYYDTFRCMGCGISTRDFYVRSANRLWDPDRERAIERAILDSGVTCSSRPKVQVQPPPLPKVTWQPPEEKTPFHQVRCNCGSTWQTLPGLTTCPRCLRVYCVGADGVVDPGGEGQGLRCPSCGAVVTDRPEKGAAYLCLSCGAWVGADAEGRKVAAQEARREKEQREAFYPTPENLHDDRVRAVILECYAFSTEGPSGASDWCWERDGKCLLYLGKRCGWFEDAVWPARFKVWEELKVRREKPAAEAPAAPRALEEAGEEAPVVVKARPRTDAWEFDGDTWALYTEDPARAEEARKAGLREMCAYTRRGATFAWQFLGPKELVRELAGKKKLGVSPKKAAPAERVEEERPSPRPLALFSACAECGEPFAPKSNRQAYCEACGEKVKRQRAAQRKARERERRRAESGVNPSNVTL
ncbi:hypothetical protein [Desulfovirgula thermocuniculi]|uniref:hypothetical protein n=1 Tax=Desulfovirgula thermocuniculi TaxID=348842 RepID=UPI000405AA3F|nr:hypothetical protein [Desulfovirgula thermocuniculi]